MAYETEKAALWKYHIARQAKKKAAQIERVSAARRADEEYRGYCFDKDLRFVKRSRR